MPESGNVYCPRCGSEYRPGVEACADCGLPLVAEPPDDPQRPPIFPNMPSVVAADPVEIAGKSLRCAHCGNHSFAERRAQLNTRWMSLFDLDFLNTNATVYVCDRCGLLQWFLPLHQDGP